MHDAVRRHDLDPIDDLLLVGGAFACDALRAMIDAHRVGAVIDLREEACDDERELAAHGLAFLHLPTPDMEAVSLSMLQRGVAFATAQMDLGRTVLIHCQHGIGRSALLALCVMTARGWEPLEALERAKTRRLKVSPSPAQFEGWSRWLRAHAAAHPVSWRPPDFEAFAQIAYRHLRQG